jgi:hypothetical protein
MQLEKRHSVTESQRNNGARLDAGKTQAMDLLLRQYDDP